MREIRGLAGVLARREGPRCSAENTANKFAGLTCEWLLLQLSAEEAEQQQG